MNRVDLTRLLCLTYHDASTFSAGAPQGKQKESRALVRDGLWNDGSYVELERLLDSMNGGPYLRRLKRNLWTVYVDTPWGMFVTQKLNRNRVVEELRPYHARQGAYAVFAFSASVQYHADLGLSWIANRMPQPIVVPPVILERYGYVERRAA